MNKENEFGDLETILETIELNKIQSKSPLEKIRQHIKFNLFWGIGISFGLIVLLFFVSLLVKLFLGIVAVWCIWACFDSVKTIQKLEKEMDPSSSLLDYLKAQKLCFNEWQKNQEKTAIAIYPISITGGFILGAQVAGQQDIWLFLSQRSVLIALALCWLVFIPLCYYLTKLLFYIGFHKHFEKLENTISSLENGM